MIVCTFINGILDINIVNMAVVCIAITAITAVVYCLAGFVIALIGAALSS